MVTVFVEHWWLHHNQHQVMAEPSASAKPWQQSVHPKWRSCSSLVQPVALVLLVSWQHVCSGVGGTPRAVVRLWSPLCSPSEQPGTQRLPKKRGGAPGMWQISFPCTLALQSSPRPQGQPRVCPFPWPQGPSRGCSTSGPAQGLG